MDSGLEAFSRNPTHGSFSALTFPSTEFTNYVNQRFLSYWIGLLSRLFLSLPRSRGQVSDCSSTNRERELGLDRRETG